MSLITGFELSSNFCPAFDVVLDQDQVLSGGDGDAALTAGAVIVIHRHHRHFMAVIIVCSVLLDEVILVDAHVPLVTVLDAVTVTVAGRPVSHGSRLN